MKPFVAPLPDILFCLDHIATDRNQGGWDTELAHDILNHFGQFAEAEIAPLNMRGDEIGAQIIDGRVHLPDGFQQAYDAYVAQGWPSLSAPENFGGQGLSGPIMAGVSEIFTGACHALQMVAGLAPGAVRVLEKFGTPEQQQTYIPKMVDGGWLATMCMTEPSAGSDLSAIATKATLDGDSWHLTGEKIFISGGDQDISEGILHLVLARSDNHDSPIKGLSLFLVPSHDAAGNRAPVSVTRIEEKMGLHASPTCHMIFDNAEAELLGERGQGLIAMFTLMNHARLDVALQGVAHASRAADIAADYAKERRQGGATLEEHSDVARMLNEQGALALGARAMCYVALGALEAEEQTDLVEFLTPICKCFCSEAGIRSADLGIQVLGGYGYLREYGVEQVLRDARVTAIYEGANGIHAQNLAKRMLRVNNGASADAFAQMIGAAAQSNEPLRQCLAQWQEARKTLNQASDPSPFAHAFMKLSGCLFYSYAWTRIADYLAQAPDPDRYAKLNQTVQRTIPIEIDYWAALISS